MAVRTGLEPATSCVTGRHSNQLNYRTKLRGQDLNLRPSGYEPDELPDCSTPQPVPSNEGRAFSPKRRPFANPFSRLASLRRGRANGAWFGSHSRIRATATAYRTTRSLQYFLASGP